MATKTTGASMYSGLLQTNQELARAKEEAANVTGKALGEGVKPLQGYLMGVAAKEQKRLDQLDNDMNIAGSYLGRMSDISGILGEFEGEINEFAVTTKNLLNDIAKDESLNQFEKRAKYTDAVNAFNKRVSLYSGDQEIIANLTGRWANGTISKANDLTGDDYLIGRALATGNFTVKNGKYSIFDDNNNPIQLKNSNIDSNRIRNLSILDTKYNFDEISAGYAQIGATAKTEQELERLVRQASLSFGTVESARSQLIEGDYYTYDEVANDTLEQLQQKIYEAGYNTANQTFHAEKPKIQLAGTAEQMGMRIMNTYDSAVKAGNYNSLLGIKYGGDIVSAYKVTPEGLQLQTVDSKGRLVDTSLINPNDPRTRSAVLNELINASAGTPTQKNEALNFIAAYVPPSAAPSSDEPKKEPTTTIGYPEYFNTFNTDVPNQLKNEDGEVIKSKSKEDNYVRSVLNVTGSASMGMEGRKVANMVRSDYNGVFSEANIRKAAYELNYNSTKDSEGRPFGKSAIEAADLAGQSAAANQKVALLAIGSANEQNIDLNTRNKLRDKLSDIQATLNTGKSLSELTNKDIAIYNYIKAGGQLSNYETALADLQKERESEADRAEAAIG